MRTLKFILEEKGVDNYALPSPPRRIELCTEEIRLNEILEEFENFLKACGYCFDGKIVIDEEANMMASLDDGSEI